MTATSCVFLGDPAEPAPAATRINGEPALALPLCDGEAVRWVEVRDTRSQDGEGPAVWRIEARRPSAQSEFVLGDTPPGFDETVPLAALPARELTAVVMTDDGIVLMGVVDFDRVEEGKLYVDTKQRRTMSGIRDDRSC